MGELVSCGCGVGSGQADKRMVYYTILYYAILDFLITYDQNVVFYLKHHKHKRIGRAPFFIICIKVPFSVISQ